jgi:hypothetical protein
MSNVVYGDASCAGLELVLRRDPPPDADRWTLLLARRDGSTAPMPDLVRVSFVLAPRVQLKPERTANAFFLENVSTDDDGMLDVLPVDTFSRAGSVIEIFIRELVLLADAELEVEGATFIEAASVSFRLNVVTDRPAARVMPMVFEAMQFLCVGGGPGRSVSIP